MSRFIIAGLGNPDKEYENSPHSVGRMVVEEFRREEKFPVWSLLNKGALSVSKGKLGVKPIWLVLPEEMMNNSGKSLQTLIKSLNQIKELIVVHDDVDLPLGRFKFSFNRGSAGHRGVDSIMKKLGSRQFFRLRVGICPVTPTGKMKKPQSGKEMIDYLLKPWPASRSLVLKKSVKKAQLALASFLQHTKGSNVGPRVQKD